MNIYTFGVLHYRYILSCNYIFSISSMVIGQWIEWKQ